MTTPVDAATKQSKSAGVVLQSGSRLLGLVLNFFFIPACIRWVGNGGYDAYLFGISASAFIGLADFGLSTSTQRYMGEALARGDLVRVASLYRFARRTYLLAGGVALAAFLAFSAFIAAPGHHRPSDPTWILLLLAGVQAVSGLMMVPATSLAYCLGRFREVAGIYALQAVLTPLVGFPVVYWFRNPESITLSLAVGTLIAAMLAYRICGADALPKPRKLTRAEAKQVVSLGAKAYPNSITTVIGGNADRIQVKIAGIEGSLASYGIGSRVPEQLSQILAPISSTVYPEYTRLAHTDEAAFTESVERNVRFALVLSSSIVLVPCALSECILRTWLGHDKFVSLPPGIVWVTPLMALYRTLELVYGSISGAFFAKGVPQYVLPFSVFNAVVTVVATVPMYRWQGIAGVGIMNALIDIVQLAPMIILLKRFAIPRLSIREVAASFAGILGLALVIAAALHWGVDHPLALWHPVVGFVLAPICGLSSVVAMTRMRLCSVPERVAIRAVRFRAMGVPVGAWLLGLPTTPVGEAA